jgi:hypothetical protein
LYSQGGVILERGVRLFASRKEFVFQYKRGDIVVVVGS